MKLHLIMGSMFSGKTKEALRRASCFASIGKSVVCVSPNIDTRDVHQRLATHDGSLSAACVKIDTLDEIFHRVVRGGSPTDDAPSVIVIDELQFFDGVGAFIERAERELPGVIFIATCLNGDSSRRPWKAVSEAIPLADTITHVTAYCTECGDGTPAAFSLRIHEDDRLPADIDAIELIEPCQSTTELTDGDHRQRGKSQVEIGGKNIYRPVCRMHWN